MACLRDGHALASAQSLTEAAERMRRERKQTHPHEVVRETMPAQAAAAMVKLACELDDARGRIERLESVIASLAREAAREVGA